VVKVSPVRGIAAALFGSLSLLLLDFSFLGALVGGSLQLDLASGFQLVLSGASPNLAEIVTLQGYWGFVLPGRGLSILPAVPSIWLIVGGGIVAESVGFTTIMLRDERYAKRAGGILVLGGLLILIGSLVTFVAIFFAVSKIVIPYVTFYPGWAIILELFLGLFTLLTGLKERRIRLHRADVPFIGEYKDLPSGNSDL
jgi:hypothetical protein